VLKKYVTTGFDASQNELLLLKTAVQALEQSHPFGVFFPLLSKIISEQN